jgi:predicted nicotinamide N-methyase
VDAPARDTAVRATATHAPFAAPPDRAPFVALLERVAPFTPVPLTPGISVFCARSLVEVWEAAEALAGRTLPAPFWAYPWAGGQALARVLLDHPEWVRGQRVLDLGAGGGVASIAAATAGAAAVTANDVDPWALLTARIAAERNGITLATSAADLTRASDRLRDFDVLLCSELAYERSAAPAQRSLIAHARGQGLRVLLADAGRTYFDPLGLEEVARCELRVPRDLEGVARRVARVFHGAPRSSA